jgi:hypothetical protein
MISDVSIEELHEFAASIGIKRCWYHRGKWPHYDIPKRRRENFAATYGVKLVDSRTIVTILKVLP